ncbi:MAG TPA: amidohydrolase family protein [Longimicrobiaceae bacterium]|nr:amidohydrolase family protein [Longimicrobiaceae bacterium]
MRFPVLALLLCAACAPARPGEPPALRTATLNPARAPALRVEVLAQIVAGPFVVLHERAACTPDGRVFDAVYTYEVQDDRITRVWRTRRVPGDPGSGVTRTGPDRGSLSPQVREFITVSEPVVALTGATVIDGTGAAPKANQTIVIRDGRIAEVGPSGSVQIPEGARRMELRGSTIVPGLVGIHNHLFIRATVGRRVQLGFSAPRLYLASGTTTVRTAGTTVPYADINTRTAIERGEIPGPRVHLTAPYVTGSGRASDREMAIIESPEAARRFVAYWAVEGATWIKASLHVRRAELQALIEEAHRRGVKVTGHLCAARRSRQRPASTLTVQARSARITTRC